VSPGPLQKHHEMADSGDFAHHPMMSVMAILRQLIESDAGEHISKLCNFEQTLDCQCQHDIREQTSGEGCSANVPTRKSLGRFVLGSKV